MLTRVMDCLRWPIEEGTYLFAYEGELLDEEAMFARYPQADGRYIACINDDSTLMAPTPRCPIWRVG